MGGLGRLLGHLLQFFFFFFCFALAKVARFAPPPLPLLLLLLLSAQMLSLSLNNLRAALEEPQNYNNKSLALEHSVLLFAHSSNCDQDGACPSVRPSACLFACLLVRLPSCLLAFLLGWLADFGSQDAGQLSLGGLVWRSNQCAGRNKTRSRTGGGRLFTGWNLCAAGRLHGRL